MDPFCDELLPIEETHFIGNGKVSPATTHVFFDPEESALPCETSWVHSLVENVRLVRAAAFAEILGISSRMAVFTHRTPNLASSRLHGLEDPILDEGVRDKTLECVRFAANITAHLQLLDSNSLDENVSTELVVGDRDNVVPELVSTSHVIQLTG